MNVTVLVYTVSCIFWDRENGVWSSEGLVLNPKTTYQKTVCRSSHLTSFASTFKIAPNPIKWSTLSVRFHLPGFVIIAFRGLFISIQLI